MAISSYIANKNVSRFSQDNHLMADAVPARKMFSSNPVSDQQYTDDNRGTSMRVVKSLARAAKTGPGLKNVQTTNVKA